jgi:hypothetical protein
MENNNKAHSFRLSKAGHRSMNVGARLSRPMEGRVWKNIASGDLYVIMPGIIGPVLIRPLGEETEPLKVTNLEQFYQEFEFMGKLPNPGEILAINAGPTPNLPRGK